MIFGLSRNLIFAAIVAMTGAGAGLWYFLSEDEPSAPAVQQEAVTTQETASEELRRETPQEETAAESERAEDTPATEDTSVAEETPPAAQEAPEVATETDSTPEIAELFTQDPAGTATEQQETVAEELTGDAPQAPEAAESITDDSAMQALTEPDEPAGLAFDIIRIEPTGEAVIAGRGAPDARVALLRNGTVHAETMSDASGNFVFIPEPFPAGTSDVTLRATGSDGNAQVSRESLTIVVDEERRRQPMVARIAPGQPTEVLSRPAPEPARIAEAATGDAPEAATSTEPTTTPDTASDDTDTGSEAVAAIPEPEAAPEATQETVERTPEPADESSVAARDATTADDEPAAERAGVRIVAVEAETGGGLFVSGEAQALAAIRLYLNDTLVARAEADYAGDVSFAIRRGVRAGRYQVRLDDVDPATGSVLSRAEVGFTVPEAVATAPAPAPEPDTASVASAEQPAQTPDPAADAGETAGEAAGDPVAEAPATPAEPPGEAAGEVAAVESGEADTPPATERADATVVVPELSTALVERGDSLWRISRQVYGRGIRYTEIFEANQDQIRNPNLIYPGQVFVLPPDEEIAAEGALQEAPSPQ
ncbi:MAG: LysM peptidoglycan-binding domain-containing protein [Salinarimonas sp.]|nr:LysM peptidoglycan-binding domain-containing protein [Salinarimonas sp.]